MSVKTLHPMARRDGTVAIPTVWNVLAWTILADEDSTQPARDLARRVLAASPEPTA